MYNQKNLTNLVFIIALVILSSCGGGSSQQSTINGIITTITDIPLAGVTVTVGHKSTTTDKSGSYVLTDITPKEALALQFSINNFWPVNRQISLPVGITLVVDVKLASVEGSGAFDSTVGGLYEVDSTSITLPANAYVIADTQKSYKGKIIVLSRYYNVQNFDHALAFPNSYKIENPDNTKTLLQSFGAQRITLLGAQGEQLELASNTVAIIEIPATHALPEGQVMKMWRYKAADGNWEFEDTPVFKKDRYRAILSQVGLVSLGVAAASMGTVTGCVVNPNNEPQQHAQAEAVGANWIASTLDTDQNGNFSITVTAGSPFFIRASKNGTINGLDGEFTVAAGETLELTDCIVLTSPKAKFTVTWGAEPRDLDAHLVFTRGEGNSATTNDVFFSNQSIDGVLLSDEAADGNGTETIDINSLTDGEYVFSVHHFNGLLNMSQSSASAKLDITGQASRTLVAPEGATGVNDIWTVWKITVTSGAISVTTINKIAKKSLNKIIGRIDVSAKGIIRD